MEKDNEYCEKHCKGYRDTGGRCFADGRCDAYWEYQKQKGTMKQVTEKMNPQKEWFEKAKEIRNVEQLTDFAKELLEDTQHDYGTVCHAIAALAIGAAWYGAHSQGITGFQAGFIMWDFIEQWEYSDNKCGLRIIDYDKMLYPQYEDKFEKVITSKQFKKMQEVAAEKLKEKGRAHPDVVKHWESIVSGTVPFGYKLVKED